MDAAVFFLHTHEYCHSLARVKMQRMHVHEQMAHPCNPAVLYLFSVWLCDLLKVMQ